MNMENRDENLWKIAKARVSFKRHLGTYVIINAFFWATWLIGDNFEGDNLPWPAWTTIGWGIGLAFHYYDAYLSSPGSVEKEYEKLKNE